MNTWIIYIFCETKVLCSVLLLKQIALFPYDFLKAILNDPRVVSNGLGVHFHYEQWCCSSISGDGVNLCKPSMIGGNQKAENQPL